MVGHRFVEAAVERGLLGDTSVVVVGEERRRLRPGAPSCVRRHRRRRSAARRRRTGTPTPGIELRARRPRVIALDRAAGTVATDAGGTIALRPLRARHRLVPFVPPIPGHRRDGRLRLPHDRRPRRHRGLGRRVPQRASSSAAACSASRRPTPCACSASTTTVVEFAPRLMAVQLDDGGAAGAAPRTSRRSASTCAPARPRPRCARRRDGRVVGLDVRRWATTLDADLVVFAAGIRPRDQLARDAGLRVGERGGVVVDDALRHVGDPASTPSARCACHARPGLRPRRARLRDGRRRRRPPRRRRRPRSPAPTCRPRSSCSASTSPASATPHARRRTTVDRRRPAAPGSWQKVVARRRRRRVLGAVLVGDAVAVRARSSSARAARSPTPTLIRLLIAPRRHGRRRRGVADLPDEAGVCSCHNVDVRRDLRRRRATALDDVAGDQGVHQGRHRLRLRACRCCRSCSTTSCAGRARRSSSGLCAHFAMTRPELFDLVRVTGIRTFAELVEPPRHRARAARSASRRWRRCSPRWRRATSSTASRPRLQDTNDHFLANLQRDGTYSVVPRVPGGEITPDQLIAHRRGRPRLRPLHQDHRRPAHRPVRRPGRAAARRSGRGWSTPASSRATPTARRCAR